MERVLFIDDDQGVLTALARELRHEPWTLVTHTCPREALREIERDPPAVVVCDYRMPEINGVQLLEYCRVRSRGTVRMIMSGYSEREILLDAINHARVFGFLCKPWDSAELRQSLARAVQAWRDDAYALPGGGDGEAVEVDPDVLSSSESGLFSLALDEDQAIVLGGEAERL